MFQLYKAANIITYVLDTVKRKLYSFSHTDYYKMYGRGHALTQSVN